MPLPFQRRPGAQLRPSFSRDFAGLKTLDHGVGPAITFTRASGATFFDASGVLQTASNNAPRFDHDPATAGNPSRGLLIEESRTNSIRNSQAGGSTNGVIGSGGVAPTDWGFSGHNVNGITTEVIGTGTENGLAYLDIKFSGTPTGNDSAQVRFEGVTQIAALDGQTWTSSAYVRLVGGSLANASCAIRVLNYGPTTTFIDAAETSFSPTASALSSQRYLKTLTLSGAATASVTSTIRTFYTSGNPIDLTLRIAAPQLEQGAFPTSYIPTTTAAATRSADSAVVTPISSFYNQAEGTLFAELQRDTLNTNLATIASLDDNTLNNRVAMGLQGGSGRRMRVTIVAATASQWDEFNAGNSSVWPTRVIVAYKASDFAATVQGGAVVSQASGTVPTATHLYIGNRGGSALLANAHIRKIAYYPKRLSNTLLQQLTT